MLRDKKKFNLKEFEDNLAFYIERDAKKPDYARYRIEILLMKYTRGDNFGELTEHFEQFIQIASEYKNKKIKNGIIDTFNFSFLESDVYPILAFAVAFPVSDKTQSIIDEELFLEGKDCLTDRLIATWNPERKLASYDTWEKTAPVHAKDFNILFQAIDAPKNEQSTLIKKHLKNWHRKSWRQDISIGSDHDFTPNPCYYGQFAFEVAAIVMAFDIDDSSFREDIYYPKELVEYFRESH